LPVYTLNPLEDRRWAELCQQSPSTSVFHSTGWLAALRQTYGYEPIVYTTCPPCKTLTNGMVFCRITSWLTGRRMISVPFADHCEPVLEGPEQRQEIFAALNRTLQGERLKYIEIRPLRVDLSAESSLCEAKSFWLHWLSLRPTLANLFRGLQKDSTQRKIRRADREGLCYESGDSEVFLNKFYRMMVVVRRRHNLPPQPIEWFRNLITFLKDRLTIHLASYRERPIAGILTLRHRDTLMYKYGGSDARYHSFGGMPFLLWKAIQQAKNEGLQVFDFGRSDTDNEGLIRFKDNWGSTRSVLTYGRISATPARAAGGGQLSNFARRAFGYMPDFLSAAAGRLLYRHIG